LDIAVEGDSFENARVRLEGAIREYLGHLSTFPEADRERLQRRHAPRWLLAKLWLLATLARLSYRNSDKQDGRPTGFGTIRFRGCPVDV
jgi:hypothetical protein